MANSIVVKSKNNITSLSTLARSIWTDLVADDKMTSIMPAGKLTPPPVDVDGNVKFVLSSSLQINPLHATQPFRIYVEVEKNARMKIAIANPLQISDLGILASYPGSVAYRAANKVGMLGTKWDDKSTSVEDYPTDTCFLVRDEVVYPGGDLSGSPLSYSLTVTDHGISLFVWGDDSEQAPRSSWFVVQNPVDKTTGLPRVDKNSPIFCVYSCNTTPDGIATASEVADWLDDAVITTAPAGSGTYAAQTFVTELKKLLKSPVGGFTYTGKNLKNTVFTPDSVSIYKFVVSESDVFVPSRSVRADVDRVDSAAIINSQQQVAIASGNQYLVTIPNRLNTQRYAYTDELDLIGYTSSDVISQNSDVPVTVYGETNPRIYKAMKATGPNNTGVRILALISKDDAPQA